MNNIRFETPKPATQTSTPESSKLERRYDVDWLRVILFGMLIATHYAVFSLGVLFQNGYDAADSNAVLFLILDVMHQWRLAALFLISGMGTAFAFQRRTWQTYLQERMVRLLVPLVFTTYILFLGIVNFSDTTVRFFSIFPGRVAMPYAHLWFVFNLLIYSVLLTPVFAHLRNHPKGRFANKIRATVAARNGLGLLIVPACLLAINGIVFKPWHLGEVGMWWEFPRYLLYFLFGCFLITSRNEYFPLLEKIRTPLTLLTPILVVAYLTSKNAMGVPAVMEGGWVSHGAPAFSVGATVATFIQSFHSWFWCLFVFSWAAAILNRPSPTLGYLNAAVYPTYIVHMHVMTVIIGFGFWLGLGYYAGLIVGVPIVLLISLLMFEVVRRAKLTRVLFGIKEIARPNEDSGEVSTASSEGSSILAISAHALAIACIGLLIYIPKISPQPPAAPATAESLEVSGQQKG